MSVNLLLSYAFHADTNLRQVRNRLVCGRLLIDSGAFTAWSKGRPISLDAYAEYLETWRGCWDHAVTLDVIGNGRETAKNTRKLHAKGLPVMPVFTRGDKLREFDAMVQENGYVCVGGLVGLPVPAQKARVKMLQRRAQDQGGGIHALGIGSVAVLRDAMPYSSDSSTVSGAFQFGKVIYFNGKDVVAVYPNKPADRAKMLRDAKLIRGHGIDLGPLVRAGRLPGASSGRAALIQSMGLAFAVADEWLKRRAVVPAPHPGIAHGATDPGPHYFNATTTTDLPALSQLDARLHGPHLYAAITPSFGVEPIAELDRALHTGQSVPSVWRVYSAHHRCRATAPETTPEEHAHA
jgi:hypothetical protein